MRKKWMLLSLCAVAAFSAAGTALSADAVKLIVNGRLIATDVPPQIVNGRTMVPIRAAAEALGADVNWNASERSVTIDTSAANAPDNRLAQLERWIAPASAESAAQTWAEAVKLRNGAVQFALLSPELQSQWGEAYEEAGWVTGVSSPWVDSYAVSHEGSSADGERYFVTFRTAASTGYAGTEVVQLTVRQADDRWIISELQNFGSTVLPFGSSGAASHFLDAKTGWIAGRDEQGAYVARTQDGGSSWDVAAAAGDDHPALLAFLDSRRGWMLTVGEAAMNQSVKNVYRTEDGGKTWDIVSSNAGDAAKGKALSRVGVPTGLVFRSVESGFVTMNNPVSDELLFFRTADGGATWVPVTIPLGDVRYDFAAISAPVFSGPDRMSGTVAITFTDGDREQTVVYRTDDGGATWKPARP